MKAEPRYKPGDRIGGRYQVHKALMGGMGEVYLCLDLEEMIPFALKTFQQRYLIDAQRLRRAFEQEVATWVALEKHPNIVHCYAMISLDNQPFMVLEWVAGEEGKGTDLRSWLRHSPLDLRLSLQIAIDVCNGLLHAQTKQPGLIHRDLKPENILVAQGGLAKITDFGLAQIVQVAGLEIGQASDTADRRHSLVGVSGVTGTPAYMAPEQWRGEPVDERTDIYALGCILYEMLTGIMPFTVDFTPTTPQQMQTWLQAMQTAHEYAPYPKLSNVFTPDLDELLLGCLAKAQRERPASLADLASQLTKVYQQHASQPPLARPDPGGFTVVDYNNRGVTYALLEENERALADYGRAIELDPNYAQAYANRGNIYAALQEYERALADYERAIELDPNLAQAYANRGNTYHRVHEYNRALADYGQAIELDPNYAQAYSNRGLTYAVLEENEEALADYGRAIDLDPHYALAYANRGNTYHRIHEYNRALADYAQAIELDPNDANTYYNRGVMYAAFEENERALADYTRAIELDPNDAKAYVYRGNTSADMGEYEQALADYARAIELDPNNALAYANRGNTYHRMQEYERALVDYGRAIDLDPNDTKSYSNRGLTYAALGEYERALADYAWAIDLDPNDALTYYNRGNTYGALRAYERALADFGRAIEFDPNYALAYYYRGRTYAALKQYEQALADYGRAIELDPHLAQAYLNKGITVALMGHLREALPYLDKAAQLGDQNGMQSAFLVRQQLGIEVEP